MRPGRGVLFPCVTYCYFVAQQLRTLHSGGWREIFGWDGVTSHSDRILESVRRWAQLLPEERRPDILEDLILDGMSDLADICEAWKEKSGKLTAGDAVFLEDCVFKAGANWQNKQSKKAQWDITRDLLNINLDLQLYELTALVAAGGGKTAEIWLELNPGMDAGELIEVCTWHETEPYPFKKLSRALSGSVTGKRAGVFIREHYAIFEAARERTGEGKAVVTKARKLTKTRRNKIAVTGWPSARARAALAEAEELKNEYIRKAFELETLITRPAFAHREFPGVAELFTQLVFLQDAAWKKDNDEVVARASAAKKAFDKAWEEAGGEKGAMFMWRCNESAQFSTLLTTMRKQEALENTDAKDGIVAGEKKKENIKKLTGILGGARALGERLAIESGREQESEKAHQTSKQI